MDHLRQRKSTQLRVCLQHPVEHRSLTTHLERDRLSGGEAVPIEAVDLTTSFLGRRLSAPILIGAMTGGTPEAGPINSNLAAAAQRLGLGMGVGSQRAALEDPSLRTSYQVRDVAPDIVLLANLGIAQLGQGWGAAEARAAVEMIQADALMLHYNPFQELVQEPESADLSAGLQAVRDLVGALPVPVMVKEVGWGLPVEVAVQLWGYGVRHFDTGGAGGTCWAEVLRYTCERDAERALVEEIARRGTPTAEVIRALRGALPEATIIAGGGIRTGRDIAVALALGADLVSVARPLLQPATGSAAAVEEWLAAATCALREAMAKIGAKDLAALKRGQVVLGEG